MKSPALLAPAPSPALPDRDPITSEVARQYQDVRTARLLRVLLIILGLTGLTSAIIASALSENRLSMQLISGSVALGAVGLLWVLQQGRVHLVANAVIVLLFGVVTAAEFVLTGRLGADIAAYLLVVVLAGTVLKPPALVAVILSSVCAIGVITVSRYPNDYATNLTAQLDAISYSMLCILMGWVIVLSQRGLSKALASSEYYFESLIHTSRDIVVVLGHDHTIQYESPAVERVLGHSPGQRVGHNWSDYVHPDDLTAARQAIQHRLANADAAAPPLVVRVLHGNGSWVEMECIAQFIQDRKQDAPSLLISMRDIGLRRQVETRLEQQLAFEQLVADISSRFMALPGERVDDGIQYALQRLGEFMDADLCLLFQISDDRTINRNTHEWCAPGIPSQKAQRPALPLDLDSDWWLGKLISDGLICFPDLDAELPPDVPDPLKQILRAKGLQSLVSVPIARRGVVLGELGMDSYRKPIRFSDDNVRLLRVVAELIGGAIERQRAALALQAERDHLEQRVNERTHELQQLLEMTRTMSSELALQPLLELVLVGLKRTVGYTSAAIAELPEGNLVHTLVADGPDADTRMRSSQWSYDLERDLHLREIVERRVPAIIPDVNADTPFARSHRARYLRTIGEIPVYLKSSLYLPLISRDKYIGHMALHSNVTGYFDSARAEIAFAFARQAAVAIENARLHEEARRNATLLERRRLARELHDSVSQALFGIVLGSRTAMQLGANSPAENALKYVLDLSEGALAEMRALIFELRPESLQTEGLLVALDKQAKALAARHNLAVHLEVDHQEPPLGIEAKEALYRIALEAIQNTIKHAHATEVTLSIKTQREPAPGRVTLVITDNGNGFDPGKPVQGHFGLRIMRERAEQLGGSVTISSLPERGAQERRAQEHGTRVAVVLPCEIGLA